MNDTPILLKPTIFEDQRGYFFESYNKKYFKNQNVDIDFIQDNFSYSRNKGTIRGMHCQIQPYAQAKLVRCMQGKILDFIVDIRKSSESYLKSYSFELSKENSNQLYVPVGFLHGFITLEDNTEVSYKCSNYYNKASDRSVKYDDPILNISWPKFNEYFLSEKDQNAKNFNELDIRF